MHDEEVNLPCNPAKNKDIRINYSAVDSIKREALPNAIIIEIIQSIYALPEQQRKLMALYLFTGMRRGEIFALRTEDFDFEAKLINVSKSVTYPACPFRPFKKEVS